MSQFHKLTITTINKETDKCVIIGFETPKELKDTFCFKAGQYITLKTKIKGKEIRRDYSLCSSPKSGELKIAVKEVESGTFSTYANSQLKENDVLEVAPPNGRFIFEPNVAKSRTITAFASGSGITPIMSIAKTVLEEEPNSTFILVYGNKTPKDTIFYNEIQALQSKHKNRFDVQFVFSQSDKKNALFGRIEKSTVNYVIKNKHKDSAIDAFYLCGPEGMINCVSDVLIENGVEKSNIHFELFTVSTSTEALDEALTDGNTKITVIVDDEETTFTMSQKKTILESALDNDIDAPYSCQGGICSSCIARLTEGKATMRQNNILTDSELAEGLILTCQAQPTTSIIVVDYDDV
ncbi:MAG: ferredoxin--NADP reductase [Flavobacteriaceae bacterium]|nr:ferredoxin--NADP reductase [Flavobacteriaceae bacterium]